METPTPTLEQREIRGVTFKLISTITISTAAIIGVVIRVYLSIMSGINNANNANAIQDLRIQELSIRIDKLDAEVKEMKEEKIYYPQNYQQ